MAYKWFLLSAGFGNVRAQYSLGEMCYNGKGVEQSYEEAAKWYQMSANQGNRDAQFILGWMYDSGEGVEQSYEEAAKWYQMSADQGNRDAQFNLGHMYYSGEGVEQSYEKASLWYLRSAEQGVAIAQCNLGWMYENGKGVEQSYVEAVKWYQRSAEQGNASAQFNLAEMYDSGEGVEQSYGEALKWYQKAVDNGIEEAKEKVSSIFTIIKELGGKASKLNVESVLERHNLELINNGYADMYACELEDEVGSHPAGEILEEGSTSQKFGCSDEVDDWQHFKDSLSSNQLSYLFKKIHSIEVKRDFEIEETINTIANETIGDSVLDNGVIVEDYLEELEHLFND